MLHQTECIPYGTFFDQFAIPHAVNADAVERELFAGWRIAQKFADMRSGNCPMMRCQFCMIDGVSVGIVFVNPLRTLFITLVVSLFLS